MCKKITIIGLTLLITAAALCGCTSAVDFFTGDDEKTEYADSNRVYIPIERVRTLNPAISKDEDTYYISKLVYDGLFTLDKNLAVQPQLAEEWSYDEDDLSHTITLQRGIRWHDGKDLSAADIKFTIDSLISLSHTGETLYGEYVSNIASIRLDKADDLKFRIFYKSERDTSLDNLVFPILPSHAYKNVSALKNDDDFSMVGTGPYCMKEYNSLSHITLVGYEGYDGEVPQNELVFQILPDTRDAINLMDVDNISILFDKAADRDTLISNKNVNVFNFPANEAEFIAFNFGKEMLAKKKVRQAFACAVDCQAILEATNYKNGVMSDSLYYPGYLGEENQGDVYPYDLERAAELLSEAGYRDTDNDGFVEDADDNEISLVILVNEDNAARVAAAQLLKNSLDKLPIETRIEYASWDSYNTKLQNGDFDIFIGGYQFDERYDLRMLLHTNYNNVIRYSNPRLDEYLDKMQSGAASELEKREAFQQVKGILADEIPYYCLFYKTYGAYTTQAFRGEIAPSFNHLYRGCQGWSCTYELDANSAE